MVEEHDALLLINAKRRVLDLRIDFELHDLAELSDIEVIADVETEEKLANYALSFDYFVVDAFDDYCQQSRMLETEVLVFNLALGFTMR